PRNMYQRGHNVFEHHVKTYGPQDQFGYTDVFPMFQAERFDPRAWIEVFKNAGARFIVPVAEHHDGFAMYETKLNRWNAAEMGPKRDIIGELASAARDAGLIFGASTHRIEHFWFLNGGTQFSSDVTDPQFADLYGPAKPDNTPPDAAWMEDLLARCIELADKYQPQLFYFDWWIEQPAAKPYLRQFAAHYYNRAAQWNKGVAINYKHDAYAPGSAVFDVERGQMAELQPNFWQTDTALATNSWGYVDGMRYKTAEWIVTDLIDIVSKNGSLLLNVGPRADGTIPDEDQAILRDIGAWLKLNGEAIYATRPWKVYGEGPTQITGGGFTDQQPRTFTTEDFRFTTRGQRTIYAICLGRAKPGQALSIASLGSNIKLLPAEIHRVSILGQADDKVSWSREAAGLRITLPDDLRDGTFGVSFKIEHA
ncbi:MAG: alpha-L-fucosidase, partial [Anaerolineae bacterium]|nr:alpha-L-fucosidase [Phycisphaerae bacterium]